MIEPMDPVDIIKRYYREDRPAFNILSYHGEKVAEKALAAARTVAHLQPDYEFIEQAAMLHDIGIFLTRTPDLDCHGPYPYVCHGYLGRNLLNDHGLPTHGLVCERHVGTGLSAQDINRQNLPLPARDMLPLSLEEIIISYADQFFSKQKDMAGKEKTVDDILRILCRYGPEKTERFKRWHDMFSTCPKKT